MSFTPNSLPLIPVQLGSSKPENVSLVIRQGETVRQPIAVIQRSLDIVSIQAYSETQALVATRSDHCLKECDRIILNGVQCRLACNSVDGCYEVGAVQSGASFLIEDLAIAGDPTATCTQCYGGQVLVPVDLTGTQTFAQVRQGYSAESDR